MARPKKAVEPENLEQEIEAGMQAFAPRRPSGRNTYANREFRNLTIPEVLFRQEGEDVFVTDENTGKDEWIANGHRQPPIVFVTDDVLTVQRQVHSVSARLKLDVRCYSGKVVYTDETGVDRVARSVVVRVLRNANYKNPEWIKNNIKLPPDEELLAVPGKPIRNPVFREIWSKISKLLNDGATREDAIAAMLDEYFEDDDGLFYALKAAHRLQNFDDYAIQDFWSAILKKQPDFPVLRTKATTKIIVDTERIADRQKNQRLADICRAMREKINAAEQAAGLIRKGRPRKAS